MPTCIKIKGRRRQICAGDLDRRITLTTRDIQTTEIGIPDFSEDFTGAIERWAMIQTEKGDEFFSFNNLDRVFSHSFYLRFDPLVTSSYYIEFDGNRYDILNVEDLDERHEFLRLKCAVLGDQTKASNFA